MRRKFKLWRLRVQNFLFWAWGFLITLGLYSLFLDLLKVLEPLEYVLVRYTSLALIVVAISGYIFKRFKL